MSQFATTEVPSSSSATEAIELLKKQANEHFLNGHYEEAEVLYTKCLSMNVDNDMKVILLTNRSAAKLGLKHFEEALQDANDAIAMDSSSLKAYYRKASALEGKQHFREAYETWLVASKQCEHTAALVKQLELAKSKWRKVFRQDIHVIVDHDDLLHRYALLTDKRERLSTLAHFWNDSTSLERFEYFLLLLKLIGGEGVLSESNREYISADVMVEMPMHNYIDLPRTRLTTWFDYFQALPSHEKPKIYEQIWNLLSSEEKNDIIVDLKLFLSPPDLQGNAGEDDI